MTTSSPDLAVLVVAYFSSDDVEELLTSLVEHRGDAQVVVSVVDNSRDPAELARLQAIAERTDPSVEILVRAAPDNLGYAAGNNLAHAAIEARLPAAVAVVNPDVRFVAGDLAEVVEATRRHPAALVTARTLLRGRWNTGIGAMRRWSGTSWWQSPDEDVRPGGLTYPGGHFIAASAEAWRTWGGFDDRYFLYCEEIDLVLRAGLSEEDLVVLDGVRLAHAGGGTTRTEAGAKSPAEYRHGTRSRVVLYRTHAALRPFLLPLLAARVGYAITLAMRGDLTSARLVRDGLVDGARARLAGRSRR